jgi:hypothetical protein
MVQHRTGCINAQTCISLGNTAGTIHAIDSAPEIYSYFGHSAGLKVSKHRIKIVHRLARHSPQRLLAILLKVARVSGMCYRRRERRSYKTTPHCVPINALKPGMSHYILSPGNARAQSLLGIGLKEPEKEITGPWLEEVWKDQAARQDLFVYLEGRVVVVGREAGEHLVDEHAKGPPVNRPAVSAAQNNLRRKILRSPAKGPCHILRDDLCKAKVGNLDVSPGVKQKVLRLQVAVDDAQSVHVIEGKDDLCSVEAGCSRRQPQRPAHEGEELAAYCVFKQHVEMVSVLEGAVESDDKGTGKAAKQHSFREDVIDLVQPDNVRLPHNLHGKVFVVIAQPCQTHSSKSARPNGPSQDKVVESEEFQSPVDARRSEERQWSGALCLEGLWL